MDKKQWLGGLCGIMTGIFWGFSGVCGQFLFETRGITSEWLVPIRLSVSGVIMFGYLFLTKREELFALARNRRDFLRTIVCGVCGTMMFISSILPGKLYEKYSTQVVMGWGFVFAGIVLSCFLKPWTYEVSWDFPTVGAVSVIILLGSVAAYGLYAIMVKQIGPTKASLFVTSEAVAATVISALWLKTVFYPIDLIGFVMILSTVFILTLGKEKKEEKICRSYWIKQVGESS